MRTGPAEGVARVTWKLARGSKYGPIEALHSETRGELVTQHTWIQSNTGSSLGSETEHAMPLWVPSIVAAFHLSELCSQPWMMIPNVAFHLICLLHIELMMHMNPYVY